MRPPSPLMAKALNQALNEVVKKNAEDRVKFEAELEVKLGAKFE